MMTIGLLIFSSLSPAMNFEHHEPPATRSNCRHDLVAACVADHTAARAAQLELAAAAGAKVAVLAGDRESLAINERALVEKIRAKEVTIAMIEREQSEKQGEAAAIFSSGPSLEEIFFRDAQENTWRELQGEERRSRLNNLADSSRNATAEMQEAQRKLATLISGLDQEILPYEQARTLHARNAEAHFSMCTGGCRSEFCPTE